MQSRGGRGLPPAREANPEHPRAPTGLAGEGAEPPAEVPPGVEGWSRGLLRSQAQTTSARMSPVISPLTRAFDFVLPVTVSINTGGKSLPARAWAVG